MVGGTGFLGHHVVGGLLGQDHRVTVVARGRPASLPAGVNAIVADAVTASRQEWAEILAGHDGVVFAAGVDDRSVPPAPALPYFQRGNVEPVARLVAAAREVGCARAVILGSYFTAVDRQRPHLELPRRHPYIRSRVEQATHARRAAGPDVAVAVLEIPFVFGSAPGRRPLWAPAVPLLRSRLPLFAPPGGTAVVSARTVGEATVAALQRRADGNYPVAEENLTWTDLLRRFAVAAGRRQPVRLRRLPRGLLAAAVRPVGLARRLRRRESGLDTATLAGLLTCGLYVDLDVGRRDLGVAAGNVDQALRETVAASIR